MVKANESFTLSLLGGIAIPIVIIALSIVAAFASAFESLHPLLNVWWDIVSVLLRLPILVYGKWFGVCTNCDPAIVPIWIKVVSLVWDIALYASLTYLYLKWRKQRVNS